MIELEELRQFLLKANKPHADGTAEIKKEANGSRTITFSSGNWLMEDNFYGGEPYGGQQIILYNGEPVWICVYYGRVLDTQLSPDEVYDFLRQALKHPDKNQPQRGPASYKQGNLEYKNILFDDDLDDYWGREMILEDEEEVYWARYMGGLVDQRFRGSI